MLIQGSFLSSLLNLLPQKGMVKMIDCTKTENYFAEKLKMTKRTKNGLCEINCSNCPLSSNNNGEGLFCSDFEMYYPEKAVKAVQEWSDEHPPKTFLTEFLENYPNAQLKTVLLYSPGAIPLGIPKCICPYHLGLMSVDNCRKDHNCVKCWNRPIEDGEE